MRAALNDRQARARSGRPSGVFGRAAAGLAAGVLAGAGGSVLGGCESSSTYSVEVRNGARSLVRARIVLDAPFENDATLDTTDVRPGEVGTLGPVVVRGVGRVALSVTRPSEIGLPPVEEPLDAGAWVYETDDRSQFGVDGVTVMRIGPQATEPGK
ncbi:MAG: hypothetical protein AAF108_10615 [Planctomycetota bacterium]